MAAAVDGRSSSASLGAGELGPRAREMLEQLEEALGRARQVRARTAQRERALLWNKNKKAFTTRGSSCVEVMCP
jgi:hypothetical protein